MWHDTRLGHPKFERNLCLCRHDLEHPAANERQDATAQHTQAGDRHRILEFEINHDVPEARCSRQGLAISQYIRRIARMGVIDGRMFIRVGPRE